jgi:signal peptidase I
MTGQKKSAGKWNKIGRIATWVAGGLISLMIAGMLLVYFMPGYGIYFVRTGSMVPTINPGDLVITGPTDNLQLGDIITFQKGTDSFTHRLIARDGDMLQTMGDANEEPDQTLTPVTDVLGKYLFRVPYLGYINGFVSSRQGWFIAIIIPTIVLVLFIVKDILKEAFKGADKKEDTEKKGGDVITGTEIQASTNLVNNHVLTNNNKEKTLK